jgi:hypothetical protein
MLVMFPQANVDEVLSAFSMRFVALVALVALVTLATLVSLVSVVSLCQLVHKKGSCSGDVSYPISCTYAAAMR